MKMGEESGEGYIVGWRDKAKDIYKAMGVVFDDIADYGSSPSAKGVGGNKIGADVSPAQRGGVVQNNTLNVKFEDIDQVYKLVQIFENLTHSRVVFEGVI